MGLGGIVDEMGVARLLAGTPPPIPVALEFAPPGPVAQPPIPGEPLDILSHEFALPSEHEAPHETEAAEGFEATTFEAPAEPVHSLSELDASLESGVPEFRAPEHVPTLEGLEDSGGLAHEETQSARATAAAPVIHD